MTVPLFMVGHNQPSHTTLFQPLNQETTLNTNLSLFVRVSRQPKLKTTTNCLVGETFWCKFQEIVRPDNVHVREKDRAFICFPFAFVDASLSINAL